MTSLRCLVALLTLPLLAACASDPVAETAPADDFGHSVRHMVRAQTFNPAAGKTAQPPAALDGQRAEAAMQGYRSGVPTITPDSGHNSATVWTERDDTGGK